MNKGKKGASYVGGLFMSLVLCCAGWGCGCSSPRNPPASARAEEWISVPDDVTVDLRSEEIDRERVYQLEADWRLEAEEILDAVPIIELSDEQFKRYTESAFKGKRGMRPYLVRGVQFDGARGRFGVYEIDKTLWVQYSCLLKRSVPLVRQPLIVVLASKPVRVYVSTLAAR